MLFFDHLPPGINHVIVGNEPLPNSLHQEARDSIQNFIYIEVFPVVIRLASNLQAKKRTPSETSLFQKLELFKVVRMLLL